MNYFLNNYRIFLVSFIGPVIIGFIIMGIYVPIILWISKRFNINPVLWGVLSGVFLIGNISFFVYLFFNATIYFTDGEIVDVFIYNENNDKRLSIFFKAVDIPKTHEFGYRLKTYEINTGNLTGKENLVKGNVYDFRIYAPFNNKAWAYSKKSGVLLLDLYQPKILKTNMDILKQNPELGTEIRIYEEKYPVPAYDPVTHGLFIVNDQGSIFRITPDIKAESVNYSIKKKKRYYSRSSKKWVFKTNKDIFTQSKIHREDVKLSSNSKTFISPEIVEYWDDTSQKTGNIWIMHWSSEERKADHLASYINKYGEELSCINLSQIFKNKRVKPYFAIMHEGNILLYVTSLHYTLSALRTDIKDGHVLGRINYFK